MTSTIVFTILIAGAFILVAASIPFSSQCETGWKRWLAILGSFFLVVGATGFFGSALSAFGGLNCLPNSFEWPVGSSEGVISTPEGKHIVPLTSCGRIQVYNPDWSFVTGWPIDAAGGTFKLLWPTDGSIEVVTARGNLRYVFDMEGRLISKDSYKPDTYDSFPDLGQPVVVPTSPWLWVFSKPGYSWAALVIGMALCFVARRSRGGKDRSSVG